MEIKLTLTVDEVNLVLGALRELPMKIVADTHAKIRNQAQAQVSEIERAQLAQDEKAKN